MSKTSSDVKDEITADIDIVKNEVKDMQDEAKNARKEFRVVRSGMRKTIDGMRLTTKVRPLRMILGSRRKRLNAKSQLQDELRNEEE